MMNARFDTLLTPLSIDMSTGDAITPHAVQYNFSQIFDDEKSYKLWAYNIETVMAEKVETILRRGTAEQIADVPGIMQNIEESPELRAMWDKYRKQFVYAKEIEYHQIIAVLRGLTEKTDN